MFLLDAQTLQDISDTLKAIGVANLPKWWNTINTRSHAWAYNQILQYLLRRGYSKAVIDTWDEGAEYESDLTIFRALSRAGALENVSAELIKGFDRRDELKEVMVMVSGKSVPPDNPIVGQVSTGYYDHTQDIFKGATDPSNPLNPNPDQVTEW